MMLSSLFYKMPIINFRKDNYGLLFNFLIALFLFMIPLWEIGALMILALILTSLLFTGNLKNVMNKFKEYPLFLLPILLYIIYLTGMIWTEDYKEGLLELQIKSALVILPLIVISLPVNKATGKFINTGLASGLFVLIIYCLINSFISFKQTHDYHDFLYCKLSPDLHPTYFTIYLTVSILLLSDNSGNYGTYGSIIQKTGRSVLIILFVIFILLLSSRTGLISSLLVFTYYVMAKAGWLQLKWMNLLKFIFVIGLLFTGLLKLPFISERFPQITEGIQHFRNLDLASIKGDDLNSTTERLAFWKASWHVFKDHWLLGVGTGDLRPACKELYRQWNFSYGVSEFKSSHNQFLQTAAILGLPGLISLLLMWFIPLFLAMKNDYYLFSAFLFLIILNAITESLLTATGILIYTFFNAYFCRLYIYSNKIIK